MSVPDFPGMRVAEDGSRFTVTEIAYYVEYEDGSEGYVDANFVEWSIAAEEYQS